MTFQTIVNKQIWPSYCVVVFMRKNNAFLKLDFFESFKSFSEGSSRHPSARLSTQTPRLEYIKWATGYIWDFVKGML